VSRSSAAFCSLAASLLAGAASAAEVDSRVSSRENPFACLGVYQALSGAGRSIAEVADELRALLARIEEDHRSRQGSAAVTDPERAVDLCVVGRLKARLGHADAVAYLEQAIAAAPAEPAFELFAGMYWAGIRGARRPLLERAERHLYQGLAKLERLRARRATLAFHDVVDDWLHKQLLVLYQQDGAQLLPWKAYHQEHDGQWAPGLAFSSQLRASQDTRDFFYNSEMRQFTGEAAFASSDLRASSRFDRRDAWDIARAPRRFETENRLRLRHAYLGALDALHSYAFAPASQIGNFYDPNQYFNDVSVYQLGLGYERVFSLYPLFDLRLVGSYRRGRRSGIVEFEPETVETFQQIEARPSVSRFFGANKLTLDGTYVRLDFAARRGGTLEDRLRLRDIRALRLDYAVYAPLLLPSLSGGELGWERTPTRGWHLYAGAVEDRELWGLHTVVARDLYLGSRYGSPGRFELTVQGTYSQSNTENLNPNLDPPMRFSEPGFDFSSIRGSVITQLRIVDQETIPGVPPSHLGFGLDMMNLVFPVHVDHALAGRNDFENVRAGAELWMKVFGTGLGGAALLVTLGYDFQYFYRLEKGLHLARTALRLGWGEL
jgi:hypothetical protein